MDHCEQCEMVSINGLACHETGCPDAWRDDIRCCGWCGREYVPEDRHQICCEESCASALFG